MSKEFWFEARHPLRGTDLLILDAWEILEAYKRDKNRILE